MIRMPLANFVIYVVVYYKNARISLRSALLSH